MGYRKFKLKNSIGEEYPLTDQNFKHFLSEPSGLGFSKDIDGVRLGNRYKVTKREYEFPKPTGTLVFYYNSNEEIYDGYAEFIRFASHYPLKLYYYVPGTEKSEEEASMIYLDCEIVSANKSEVSYSNSMLSVPLTFQGYGFWLSNNESHLNINIEDKEAGTFTFPLTFPFSFGTDPLRDVKLSNLGTLVTPVVFTIIGECTNPYIRFFDENYNEYAACRINGTYDYVHVDANDNNEIIDLRSGSSVIGNPANMQDLTIGNPDEEDFYLTFLKIKPGTTLATITFGNDFKGAIDLTWRDEYATI